MFGQQHQNPAPSLREEYREQTTLRQGTPLRRIFISHLLPCPSPPSLPSPSLPWSSERISRSVLLRGLGPTASSYSSVPGNCPTLASASLSRPLLKYVQLREPTPDHLSLRFSVTGTCAPPSRNQSRGADPLCSLVCRADRWMPGVHRAGGAEGRAGKDKQREGAGVKPRHREEETDGFSWERERRQREAGTKPDRTEERLSSTLGGQGYFYLLFLMPRRPQRHYTASTARMDLLQG